MTKGDELRAAIAARGSVLVMFSGGLDSALLAKLGARPWQVDVMTGLVSEAVLLPRRQPLG